MKRMMALLMALAMLLCAMPALAEGGEIPYAKVVEAALSLREAAYGDFLTLKGVPEDLQETARDWTAGIDDTPDLVVCMDVNDSALVKEYRAMFRSEHPMVSYEAQSTAVGEIMSYSMVMAAYETPELEKSFNEAIDVNSALNHNMMYADSAAEEGTMLYVVLYKDALPIFILTNVENGAVSLTAYIIPSNELASYTSYARVAFWFMGWGCNMTGKEIKPE